MKTFLAAREEIEVGLPTGTAEVVMAAVNRYFHSQTKRKHVRRTAQQAMNFVAAIRGEIQPPCEAAEALEDLKIARDYIRLVTGQ